MIRRLFIVAVSLAALTACTTYNSGYRHYSPAQAGYGDYYYAPDPGPSYYAPSYLDYPAYYSLYWGFDRHYYSSWRQPHFHYGVTWFPNDWFAFSVVHRYPRYSYWHPYAPYRYSAWDHRFAWHYYSPPPRYRHRPAPRYGHPSNERHMQREQLAAGRPWRSAPNPGVPRARTALEAAAPQRVGNAPQGAAYRPQSALPAGGRNAAPATSQEARMRQQAMQAREARLREEPTRMRPALGAEAGPARHIPDRRELQGPRRTMGDTRTAPMRQAAEGRPQDPRVADAPRVRQAMPAAQPQPRIPVGQQAPQMQRELRPAPRDGTPARMAPRREATPAPTTRSAPQPRMQPAMPARAAPSPTPARQAPIRQQAPVAPMRPAPAPAPVRQSPPPMRQAAPPPRPATTRSSGRARGAIEQEP